MNNLPDMTDLPAATSIETALEVLVSHVQMLPLDRLLVDREHYQREERLKQSMEIAQHFNPNAFGIIVVSLRPDGYYYVEDGQRRCDALRMLGVRHAPCLITNTPAVEDEALAFLGLNVNRMHVVKTETFQANVTSGSELHRGIYEALARHGLAIARRHEGRRIRCVSALEEIAQTSLDLLDTVITLALEGYGDLDGGLTGMHLLGLYRFILMHKDNGFETPRLRRVMKASTPQDLYKKAKTLQDAWHGRLELNLARALTVEYNRSLARLEQRLPTPWATGRDVLA